MNAVKIYKASKKNILESYGTLACARPVNEVPEVNSQYFINVIFFTDTHAMENNPKSRLGSPLETIKNKIKFIADFESKLIDHSSIDTIVICGGDVFDKYNASHKVVSAMREAFGSFKSKFIGLCIGNHDVPSKNLDSFKEETALGSLVQSLTTVYDTDYEREGPNYPLERLVTGPSQIIHPHPDLYFKNSPVVIPVHADGDLYNELVTSKTLDLTNVHPESLSNGDYRIVNAHVPIYGHATDLGIDVHDIDVIGADLMLCGDIHEGFQPFQTPSGCWVASPGSVYRCKISEKDYVPSFYHIVIDVHNKKVHQWDKIKIPHEDPKKIFTGIGKAKTTVASQSYVDAIKNVSMESKEPLEKTIKKVAKKLKTSKKAVDLLMERLKP